MNIEDVIERSRESGSFSERKQFTVARSRAIRKLREFALAHRSYYILEWIQAAIANGATYVDISVDPRHVRLSYVGGGFTRAELEALFDFLFASKDNLDVADVRQLALGVNALMGLKPHKITMESGDGTLEGTTRIEIDVQGDQVVVGTPEAALAGTFIVAHFQGILAVDRGEVQAIEDRCLTSTIPLLVNDVPLFGYRSLRSPKLWGYPKTLEFDEGDLYGTIGLATTPITKNFKLLTFGTWISTTTYDFAGLRPMGGVIGYDRLRKTADHANVVQDEVYNEMWARLLPYARQLHSGKSGDAVFDVHLLDGTTLSPREVRELGIENGRIVAFDKDSVSDRNLSLAVRFGAAIDAPVLLAAKNELEHVRALAADQFELHTPSLSQTQLEFFERPISEEPPHPWLGRPLEVPDVTIPRLLGSFDEADSAARTTVNRARNPAIRVYSPADAPAGGHTLVEIRSQQREIARASVPSDFPGHHIVADLDGFPYTRVMGPDGPKIADAVARAVMTCGVDQLEEAAKRVLDSGSGVEGTATRIITLGAIVRNSFLRLRTAEAGVELRVSRHDHKVVASLFNQRLLETFDGRVLSVSALGELLEQTGGVLYAAESEIPDVVDPSVVVRADAATKHLLRRLVGRSAFEDIDSIPSWARVDPASMYDKQIEQMLDRLEADESGCAFRLLVRRAVDGPATDALDQAPLFRTALGYSLAPWQLRARLTATGCEMFDGWPHDWTRLQPSSTPKEAALAMDAFVFHQLRKLGEIRPILDIDYSVSEAMLNPDTPNRAFLDYTQIDDDEIAGIIGYPVERVESPVLVWNDRRSGATVALTETAREFGIVGRLTTDGWDEDDVRDYVSRRARTLMDTVIMRAARVATKDERGLQVLLDHVDMHLTLIRLASGEVSMSCVNPDASRILAIPLIPTESGNAVSIWHYLSEFATYGDLTSGTARIQPAESTLPVLAEWLAKTTDVPPYEEPNLALMQHQPATELDAWLSQLLTALRVDGQEPFYIQIREQPPELMFVGDHVFVSTESPLVRELKEAPSERRNEAASWLLLAAYAVINEMRLAVTNEHELLFQARIIDWLDGNFKGPATQEAQ